MGASSSTPSKATTQQREVESLAASTGALPLLQKSFAKLADPQTNTVSLQSLQQCFGLSCKGPISEASVMPDCFPQLLDHVGSSIVDLFFVPEKGGISWVEFVRGYVKCCGRMSASMSLNTLFRLFAMTVKKARLLLKLEFESDDVDCKINGSLRAIDVLVLLWICWTMMWDNATSKFVKAKANLFLPDINHLVLSAVISCADFGSGLDPWECNISSLKVELPVGKFLSWSLATVPSLTECFTQFVHTRLQNFVTMEDESGPSVSHSEDISSKASAALLLTHGRAWAISLAAKSTIREEVLKTCLAVDGIATDGNLLYRSSLHGRGLNRFWSNIEGYHGPLLLLVSASSEDANEDTGEVRRWIIGVLTQQGFENRDTFYGSSGSLFAVSPIFHAFSPSGREKNFMYSHLHPTSRVYEPNPKPVGIAFGGTSGNERIFIDEDFARATVRHHAVDKTYQSGSLIPNQGFLPVEASISEVEVWGLGGRTAKEVQTSYKKREQLFTEQRRKVDLKTFASWDDSPEKMMMDMMADPNSVQREDR